MPRPMIVVLEMLRAAARTGPENSKNTEVATAMDGQRSSGALQAMITRDGDLQPSAPAPGRTTT